MRNFIGLFTAYFKGSDKWFGIAAGLGILGMSLSSVYLSFLFNDWKVGFWNAVEARDQAGFLDGLVEFTFLAFAFILIISFTRYFAQRYCLRWRRWMTEEYIKPWLKLKDRTGVENPDQRLQQDLLMFTQLTERLSTGFITALTSLAVFTPVLWSIGAGVPVFGVDIPGYFWIICFAWSAIGLTISYLIGKKIPKLEYNNQKTEADFRYDLVQVRDGASSTTPYLMEVFSRLYANHVTLYKRFKYFTLAAISHGQVSIILPFLAAAPMFFAGALSLGILMQISHAFGEVARSLNYIFEHYLEFCELASVVTRLTEFKESLK